MIFLGYLDGVKGYLFMRFPNNSLFKGTTAIFDEEMMPKCSKVIKRRIIDVFKLYFFLKIFTPIGDKKLKRIHPFQWKRMMRMISYLITDPLHLYKETMLMIVMTITLSTVCRARRPGSRNNFHLLRDNCRLRCEGLAMNRDYLLDLIMSMGIIITPLIYIMRTDVMLLVRIVTRISSRRYLMNLEEISNWFLDLALQIPEIATSTHLRIQSHSWLS
jgi:hypothetical protein